MARVTFDSIFTKHSDGSIEPKQRLRIGGVVIGPGVRFKNTSFSGIDFSNPQFLDHDLEIKTDNNIIVIVGIY